MLQFVDVGRLRSFWTLDDFELNSLTFIQRLEAVALDGAEVYEYVFAAFHLDETETFFRVEPLNCTLLQMNSSMVPKALKFHTGDSRNKVSPSSNLCSPAALQRVSSTV